MVFRLVLIVLFFGQCVCNQESLKLLGDTCNVINMNCGCDSTPGNQGGHSANEADLGEVRAEISKSIGVQNCQEVKDILGVDTTGYYLMRDPSNMNAIFVLCDFQVRSGISTCKQLRQRDHVRESGFYWIKPAGSGEAFQVYCNFGDTEVKTEIWHDSMRETKLGSCDPKGCFSATPKYNIKQGHILKVISASRECKQYIKLRCNGVALVYKVPTSPYAWWVSRDGEKMLYWGGATSRRNGYCSCGESGTCLDNRYKCNCDQNANNVKTSDAGYLTDKTKLPVKQMRFGDTDAAVEHGWHTLGQLECTG